MAREDWTTEHDFEIGEVVYDIEDEVYFKIEGIGDGGFIEQEHGLYGSNVKNGEFHWNFIHMTRKLKEGEEY